MTKQELDLLITDLRREKGLLHDALLRQDENDTLLYEDNVLSDEFCRLRAVNDLLFGYQFTYQYVDIGRMGIFSLNESIELIKNIKSLKYNELYLRLSDFRPVTICGQIIATYVAYKQKQEDLKEVTKIVDLASSIINVDRKQAIKELMESKKRYPVFWSRVNE